MVWCSGLVARLWMHASAWLVGILTGAMLLIAVALVPFWRSLPPAEFRAWFAAHAFRIARLMVPLGAGSMVAALGALGAGRRTPDRGWLALAAGGAVGIVVVTLVVNEPANERFAAATGLSDAETVVLLGRWSTWHWARVVLGGASFYAAVRAVAAAHP